MARIVKSRNGPTLRLTPAERGTLTKAAKLADRLHTRLVDAGRDSTEDPAARLAMISNDVDELLDALLADALA